MIDPAPPAYAGLVTRALAFVTDVFILAAIELAITVAIGAFVTAITPGKQSVGLPEVLLTAAGCLAFSSAYLVGFWVLVGHTPGMRLMGIVVTGSGGEPLTLVCGLRRLAGFAMTILTLGIGFLYVLLDDRRRALQDLVAGTVVVRAGG
jgi:uncharacterized RDD family membrane protein YckC